MIHQALFTRAWLRPTASVATAACGSPGRFKAEVGLERAVSRTFSAGEDSRLRQALLTAPQPRNRLTAVTRD
jgi:hypothetical protein